MNPLLRQDCPNFRLRAVLAVLLSLALSSCAVGLPRGFTPPVTSRTIPDVPFHAQEVFQCGPASLAGVLNYLGDPVTPDEIAQAVFRPELRGSVSLDLALYPRGRGLSSRFWRGTVEDLVRSVDTGQPLVLMLDLGLGPVSTYHFLVVVGYSPQGPIVNTGRREHALLPWGEFLRTWERADSWTLLVEGKTP
ncbi:MAG: C39 family peptidase [Proteobacteria bacterium]|nr:C39 family peptidase [Pseudomonadota bacterium]